MKTAIIQCALNAQKKFKGFAYLFNGTQYVKYDWNKDRPVPGYPKNLSVWNLPGNFAHGVDAAINGEKGFEGFAYFFKGNEYVKYDWDKDQPVTGYPKALSLWKLPSGFENGIDAAFNGQGKYQGFGYMFKNGEYIKYDWANDRPVPGYPKPLSAWDLPIHFQTGIDAALNGDGKFKNYVYFFKGDEYVRYDWTTDKCNEPKSIRKLWGLEHIWNDLDPNTEVKKKALLVFIENTGQLPLPSGTPKWIEENLEKVADTVFEEIEKAINDFEKVEGTLYDQVVMLEDGTATLSELQSQLHNLARNGYLIDIVIQAHGNSTGFSGFQHATISDMDIESIGTSFGQILPIRVVYQMNCVGSQLNDEWRKIGAEAVSGADKNNFFPEPLMSSFWNKWKNGQSFENSVNGAYSDLDGYLGFAKSVSTTVNDAYIESRPVISGKGSLSL
jgi:hypothetical protein